MILFVSGRCDIPAFYSEWFFNRLKAGYVDVRNPFNAHQISRIPLQKQAIDVIVFCTKNPIPIMKRLQEIRFPFMFHVTFTPYKEDIEQVPNKRILLDAIVELAQTLGRKRVVVRYDPIFLSDKYTIEYHRRAFEKLCRIVTGRIDTIIISFVDMYKNTKANKKQIHMKDMCNEDMHTIGKLFGGIANKYALHVQTCAEEIDLTMYGIEKGACFDRMLLSEIAGHSLTHLSHVGVRKNCACINSVDIGDYNCCAHGCLYCYANYDAKQIQNRMQQHDPNSSVLIGRIKEDDHIVEKKEKSVIQEELF